MIRKYAGKYPNRKKYAGIPSIPEYNTPEKDTMIPLAKVLYLVVLKTPTFYQFGSKPHCWYVVPLAKVLYHLVVLKTPTRVPAPRLKFWM